MITTDLVNPRALSETVRNDIHTELWMRYVCLSPKVRLPLNASPQASALYKKHDRMASLSLLAITAALANAVPAFRAPSLTTILAAALCVGLFLWYENRKKNLLMELAQELVRALYADKPPRGTFFQFGEELARKYNITSFVDFNGRLDGLTKRLFISLFAFTFFIYLYTPWTISAAFFCLILSWTFLFKPVRILRTALQLT